MPDQDQTVEETTGFRWTVGDVALAASLAYCGYATARVTYLTIKDAKNLVAEKLAARKEKTED